MKARDSKNGEQQNAKRSLQAVVGRHIVHRVFSPRPLTGEWNRDYENRDVVLMAVSGAWAMVRRPGCIPYTVMVKELVPPNR